MHVLVMPTKTQTHKEIWARLEAISKISFKCQPELVEGYFELQNRFRQAQPDIRGIFEMASKNFVP